MGFQEKPWPKIPDTPAGAREGQGREVLGEALRIARGREVCV